VTRRGWLLFLALSVIWGIPYLLIKVAVRELTPASLVFLRTALGALLLLPAVMKNGNLRALLPRWRPILLFTLVEVAVPWWLLSRRRATHQQLPVGPVGGLGPAPGRPPLPPDGGPRATGRTTARRPRSRVRRRRGAPRAGPDRGRRRHRGDDAGRPRLRSRPAHRFAAPRRFPASMSWRSRSGSARSSMRRWGSPSSRRRCRRRP